MDMNVTSRPPIPPFFGCADHYLHTIRQGLVLVPSVVALAPGTRECSFWRAELPKGCIEPIRDAPGR